jgi:hypothetical protein
MTGLLVKFYLPNLNADELASAVDLVRRAYDRAPRLCGWLLDALCDEQLRRLQSRGDDVRETSVLIVAGHEWTSEELQQATTLATVMTYCVKVEAIAKLWDALVQPIQACLFARLAQLERQNYARHQAA